MAEHSPNRLDWSKPESQHGSRRSSRGPSPEPVCGGPHPGSPYGTARAVAVPGWNGGVHAPVDAGSPYGGSPCSLAAPHGLPEGSPNDDMIAYSRWHPGQCYGRPEAAGGLGAGSDGGGAMALMGVEQKLTALSRRTAAELRRAEKERGELGRKLETLELLCHRQLGGLDVRFGHAREEALSDAERASLRVQARFEQHVQQLSAALQLQSSEELRASEERTSTMMKTLVQKADAGQAGLQELQAWCREAGERLATCTEEAAMTRENTAAAKPGRLVDDSAERLEEQLELAIAKERKQAHERLRSSCSELTAHLNELRQELVEQRHSLELVAEQLEARREQTHQELIGHVADMEQQIIDLGAALASRMQSKLAPLVKALGLRAEGSSTPEEPPEDAGPLRRHLGALQERVASLECGAGQLRCQVELVHKETGDLYGSVKQLRDPLRGEQARLLEAARDEAHTAHCEVMSVDTRVAAIEERLAAQDH